MSEGTKFSKEELESINKLQEEYVGIQSKMGSLGISRLNLKNQFLELEKLEEEITKSFSELRNKERELVDGLTEKYGKGSIDLSTGTFTPNK
tara:strand:- start:3912 stop:4187 length:276 start_codon:yes stop_codon:yes gene_type:complete